MPRHPIIRPSWLTEISTPASFNIPVSCVTVRTPRSAIVTRTRHTSFRQGVVCFDKVGSIPSRDAMFQTGSIRFFHSSTQQEIIIMKLLIEIRPGEGGEDAKLLVADQASIYARFAERHGAKVDVEDRGHL